MSKCSRSLGKPLEGSCFTITGTLSVSREEFETLIQQNGGEIAKSVTKKCTHLISAVSGTKKCQDAEAKGLQVVDEEWVREKIHSTGEKPMKKMKAAPAPATAPAPTRHAASSNATLSGFVFAITGTLSVSRKEFENFILANGGTVAKSVTKKVTHLVSSEEGTKKCEEAEEKGIKIVEEQWVRDKVEGIERDDSDDNGSGDGSGADEEAIEDRYQPPLSPSYPTTNIFDQAFLDKFWESPPVPDSTGTVVTTEMLREVEQQLGFKLPASYIELIRSQNGGRPVLKGFAVKDAAEISRVDIEEVMGCDLNCEYSLIGGMGSEFWMEEWEYPRIGIYFGTCPSGGHDMICLDYRKCGIAGEPEVTHVDQELEFQKVVIAPNFETFVRGLVASDELEE